MGHRTKNYGQRIQVNLPDAVYQRIEKYMQDNEITLYTEAMRQLVELGLNITEATARNYPLLKKLEKESALLPQTDTLST